MRPALFIRVLFFIAAVAAVTRAEFLPSAHAGSKKQQQAAETIAFTAKVQGEPQASKESAINSALEAARTEIASFLKQNKNRLSWTISLSDVREKLLRDVDEGDNDDWSRDQLNGHWILVKETPEAIDEVIRATYQVRIKVSLNDQDLRKYQEQYRGEVAQQRQMWLGKLLLGIVAFLGAVAGYIRLEDATKGYYTAWLRLGLAGVVCAVGAGLWLAC